MKKLIIISLTILIFSGCKTIKHNIDVNYKAKSEFKALKYKKQISNQTVKN